MYIYVDILIITNLYADFFLLKTTARLTHTPLRNGKCILGALTGSLFSLIILLPSLSSWLLMLIRILAAGLMIIVAFGGGKTARELFRLGVIFFFVSFVFAGIEYGIAVLAGGKNMVWHNSTLYVNISMLTLVISTIVAYTAIALFRRYLDGRSSADVRYDIIIAKNGKTASVRAVGDTGNSLTDAFTGKPVVICGKDSISRLFDDGETERALAMEKGAPAPGWRLIPFSTIHSGGTLPVFKPAETVVKNLETGYIKNVDVYIGIVDREMEYAVFNPKILR